MRPTSRLLVLAGWLVAATLPGITRADDLDALNLESAPEPAAKATGRPLRFFAEAAVGRVSQRYGQPGLDTRRLSLDLSASVNLSESWRAVLSDRLDHVHPTDAGGPSTVNNLREAYASWQDAGGATVVEFGRINLRHGPAYGFNPTDYFRDGALRAVTTVDPFALRENRLGTVMLRAQRLWAGGGISLALAPKLADAPSTAGFGLDLGATNNRNRALLSWSHRLSDRVSGQMLVYADQGLGPQLGVSATALVSDAMVVHLEGSRGRVADLLARSLGQPDLEPARNRASAGLTYTLPTRTALTVEYEYNGAAPGSAGWNVAAAGGPAVLGQYLLAAQRRQDSASRHAWLLYASQQNLLWKSLDLTGLLRINADDDSRLAWLELRYHWGKADVALQWQHSQGRPLSEYGVLPYRQSVQLLGVWYF